MKKNNHAEALGDRVRGRDCRHRRLLRLVRQQTKQQHGQRQEGGGGRASAEIRHGDRRRRRQAPSSGPGRADARGRLRNGRTKSAGKRYSIRSAKRSWFPASTSGFGAIRRRIGRAGGDARGIGARHGFERRARVCSAPARKWTCRLSLGKTGGETDGAHRAGRFAGRWSVNPAAGSQLAGNQSAGSVTLLDESGRGRRSGRGRFRRARAPDAAQSSGRPDADERAGSLGAVVHSSVTVGASGDSARASRRQSATGYGAT